MLRSRNSYRMLTQVLNRSLAALAAVVLLAASAQAQYTGNNRWTTYSALNAAQGVAFDSDGTLWIATTGGILGYHAETDSFEVYRNTEGLLSLNSTAGITKDGTANLTIANHASFS